MAVFPRPPTPALSVRTAARLALAGALVASAGDVGQLWTANAARPEMHLPVPPSWLIVVATLAGALGIPLYALGYWARARSVPAAGPRAGALVGTGAVFAVLGGTTHATTGALVGAHVGRIADGLDPLSGILHSGPILLSLWILASSALIAAGFAEAALPQPSRRRLSNPLFLTIVFTVLGAALPLPWRDLIGPTAPNLAHVAFFASLLASDDISATG